MNRLFLLTSYKGNIMEILYLTVTGQPACMISISHTIYGRINGFTKGSTICEFITPHGTIFNARTKWIKPLDKDGIRCLLHHEKYADQDYIDGKGNPGYEGRKIYVKIKQNWINLIKQVNGTFEKAEIKFREAKRNKILLEKLLKNPLDFS